MASGYLSRSSSQGSFQFRASDSSLAKLAYGVLTNRFEIGELSMNREGARRRGPGRRVASGVPKGGRGGTRISRT